jgi:osmotically inducible lipoprotein OsmB
MTKVTLRLIPCLLVTAAVLGGCGTASRPGDRVAGGAAVGAAGGAAVGALFGGVGAIPGALIGAAAGGGTGAVTDERQIDLGTPVWRRNEYQG